MRKASSYLAEFELFAGTTHVIPDDDADISVSPTSQHGSDKTREANDFHLTSHHQDKTRETSFLSSDKARENLDHPSNATTNATTTSRICIPVHNDTDFEPLKSTPTTETFTSKLSSQLPQDDRAIEIERQKQLRLLTIHERLGHVSFSILKLLARCGIIPKDLAHVHPPQCPGCAYGKAHRKPTRYKGVKNKNKINPVNAPGQCVSVDRLVSPTPGFVPKHRGSPT